MNAVDRIEVVDSHTAGEPTRVVINGWPEPSGTTMVERRSSMQRDQDHLRRAVVLEPRGHDAIVGALLTPPERSDSVAGVVFFNDASYLGMCGHGFIGVVRTLEHLGRITPGEVRLDTPVGQVSATLESSGAVTIRNVPARVLRQDVSVQVPGIGEVRGDVAWGGNWFFLTEITGVPLVLEHRAELLRIATQVRDALAAAGVVGDDGAVVDHVELFGPPTVGGADSRNFVLCPGAAYDRSPCGTGTSAKMAALHARGKLKAGESWVQEGILGTTFTGWLTESPDGLVPSILGHAYVTARSTLLFDPADPFQRGIT
ncbi:MAG: proline racemase family protein [Gemmatimonadales bacterium]